LNEVVSEKTKEKGMIGHMDQCNIIIMALIAFVYVLTTPSISFGEEKPKEKHPNEDYTIPDHVLNISTENTFPNSSEDQEVVEPSKLTKSFMEEIDVPIENPNLIK